MKSVNDVLDDFRSRMGEHQGRLNAYGRFTNAYFGDTGQSTGVVAMDASGRPILRSVREEARAHSSLNLIAPIVDDFAALRGVLPSFSVVSPSSDEGQQEMALKRSRLVRQVWSQSNMDVQQPNAAFYLSCLGDVLYTLDPLLESDSDFDPVGVYITVYDPNHVFCRMRQGRWAQEIDDCYIAWTISAEECESEYGFTPNNSSCQVIVYHSRTEKQTVVDGQRQSKGTIQHDLGFVPAQWVRNKMAGGRPAQADIAHAVDLHGEVQGLMELMLDAVADTVYAPIVVVDPLNVGGDNLIVGSGQVIPVNPGGDVHRLAPAPPPAGAHQLSSTLQDALYHTTGTIPTRQEGSIDHSNISGRAVHAVQGPMETRLSLSQSILSYHFSRLNQKILLLHEKIPGLARAEVAVSGYDKQGAYSDTVTGKEVGGFVPMDHLRVKWDALLGSTKHERLVMARLAYDANLAPGSYVVEQLGEDDPEGFIAKALEEKKHMAEQMQQMQAAMQPQQGAPDATAQDQASAAAPGQQSASLAMGGQGGGGAAPPGPVQPPPPTPSTGGQPPNGSPPAGLPPFSPMDSNPAAPGMGPPPQTPDVQRLIMQALNSLPDEVVGQISGPPQITPGGIVVRVMNGAAHGGVVKQIKEAFASVGLRVKVTGKAA